MLKLAKFMEFSENSVRNFSNSQMNNAPNNHIVLRDPNIPSFQHQSLNLHNQFGYPDAMVRSPHSRFYENQNFAYGYNQGASHFNHSSAAFFGNHVPN